MSTPRDGFGLEIPYTPLADQTLEDAGNRGEEDTDKASPITSNSVKTYPHWLSLVFNACSRKVKPRSISVSSLQRITAKLGIAIIRNRYQPKINDLSVLYDKVLECNDQILINRVCHGRTYTLQATAGMLPSTCSLREWQAGAIDELLVKPLGFTISTATLLVLLAGLTTSTTWVPRYWKKHADKELQYFSTYLDREMAQVKEELKDIS